MSQRIFKNFLLKPVFHVTFVLEHLPFPMIRSFLILKTPEFPPASRKIATIARDPLPLSQQTTSKSVFKKVM